MNRTSLLALVTACIYLLAVVGMTPSVHAQAPSAADRHFADGRKALASGNFVEACRLFAASHELDPSVGTLLNLGECTVKQSKHAEARRFYKQAEALAVERKDGERAIYAKQQYDALTPHVGMLSIWIDPAVVNPQVHIDDKSTDVAPLLAGPIEIERGVHQVTLRSGGDVIAVQEVTVGATPATVRLEPKAAAPSPIMLDKPLGGTLPASRGRSKTGIYVAIGGAAVFAGGVGLAFSAKSKYDTARTKYDAAPSEALLGDINDARKTGDLATMISVTGIAAFTTGAVLYLVSGKRARNAEVAIVPTEGGAAAFFAGSW